jgi:hypothetical protein
MPESWRKPNFKQSKIDHEKIKRILSFMAKRIVNAVTATKEKIMPILPVLAAVSILYMQRESISEGAKWVVDEVTTAKDNFFSPRPEDGAAHYRTGRNHPHHGGILSKVGGLFGNGKHEKEDEEQVVLSDFNNVVRDLQRNNIHRSRFANFFK